MVYHGYSLVTFHSIFFLITCQFNAAIRFFFKSIYFISFRPLCMCVCFISAIMYVFVLFRPLCKFVVGTVKKNHFDYLSLVIGEARISWLPHTNTSLTNSSHTNRKPNSATYVHANTCKWCRRDNVTTHPPSSCNNAKNVLFEVCKPQTNQKTFKALHHH